MLCKLLILRLIISSGIFYLIQYETCIMQTNQARDIKRRIYNWTIKRQNCDGLVKQIQFSGHKTKNWLSITPASTTTYCRAALSISNTAYILLLLKGEVPGAGSDPTNETYCSSSQYIVAYQAPRTSWRPSALLLITTCSGGRFHSGFTLLVYNLAGIRSTAWSSCSL